MRLASKTVTEVGDSGEYNAGVTAGRTCTSGWVDGGPTHSQPFMHPPLLACAKSQQKLAVRTRVTGQKGNWRWKCSSLQSCLILCDPMECSLPGSSVHGDSPGKNAGVCCHALLQGIFPTQDLTCIVMELFSIVSTVLSWSHRSALFRRQGMTQDMAAWRRESLDVSLESGCHRSYLI